MAWDFAEANILVDTVGGYLPAAQYIADCIEKLPLSGGQGFASQANASQSEIAKDKLVSTDPPYYDNIGYADLSDFFYLWIRRALLAMVRDVANGELDLSVGFMRGQVKVRERE